VGEKKDERWRTEDLFKHFPDAAFDRLRRRFIEVERGERGKRRKQDLSALVPNGGK